jgi:uncharacterized protein YfbU (UPF0304 family)
VASILTLPSDEAQMKLSRIERWILSNQYKILEQLDPEQAAQYACCRNAIDCGYEGDYDWIAADVSDESDGLSSAACGEVIDILEMYSDLQRGFDALDDTSDIRDYQITFPGFDGNHESKRVGYCRHLCGGQGRYHDLRRPTDWESHRPVIDAYRRMLAVWRPIRESVHQGTRGTDPLNRARTPPGPHSLAAATARCSRVSRRFLMREPA